MSEARSPRKALLAGAAFVFAALGAGAMVGCALVGYGFEGYQGDGGNGGATSSSTQGSGGHGGQGGASSSSSSSSSASSSSASSSSSSGGIICKEPSDCDDHNECTIDSCPAGNCAFAPFPTDDGDPCTEDGCVMGKGVYHLQKSCEDANFCTFDTCNTQDGTCVHTPSPASSDGDGCTTDVCDPSTGVTTHTPLASCCSHSLCSLGVPLNPAGCDTPDSDKDCVKSVCTADPLCCSTSWDATCITIAKSLCAHAGVPYTCACAHSYCETGAVLSAACDPCVRAVCASAATAYCCDGNMNLGWNPVCVLQTHNLCNMPLGAECK